MTEDEDRLGYLDEYMQSFDKDLSRARQHPNDRESRRELEFATRSVAGYTLPSGHGQEIDRLLRPVIAQAQVTHKLAIKANGHVPALEADVVAMAQAIVKLRSLLLPLSAEISAQIRERPPRYR